jgi:hypothetical protein
MEKQQKYLQISQQIFPLTLRERLTFDSLGEANFMFVTTYRIKA